MADIIKQFGKTKIIDTGTVTKITVNGNDLLAIDHSSGNVNLLGNATFSSDNVWISASRGVSEKLYVEGSSLLAGYLSVQGTSSYIKFPGLTTTQRDALSASAGMTVYNTSDNKLQCYDGSAWTDLF